MKATFNNREIAQILRNVAAAYEVKDSDRFRVVAYQKAADSIEYGTYDLLDLWQKGKLEAVPGIGAGLAAHLDELFRTGKVKSFAAVMRDFPEAMFALIGISGIGPKTAYKLATELHLKKQSTAVKELEEAAKKGKIRTIPGFGEESEADILRSITQKKSHAYRMTLPKATLIAEEVIRWLESSEAVVKADPLGSLRRRVETVGDIDIAVASDRPQEVIKHFLAYPKKQEIIEAGPTTASIRLEEGVQIDLMIQPPDAYGALLQHFTGSKQHNIHLRDLALKKGYSLSEYGIKNNGRKMKFAGEQDFYRYLSLNWIPPELREDKGEIEAALREFKHGSPGLPDLVRLPDMKGDLHTHSNFKIETSHDEGANTLEEMLRQGEKLGYEYLGFTEHNPSVSHHSEREILDLLKKKKEAIEQINYSSEKRKNERVNNLSIKAVNGLEIDIRPDGELAIPEKGLEYLDYAIASVHSSFQLEREAMTKRILTALDHPKIKILGHPTGRKLNEREGYSLDWDKIFDFCLTHDKWLEINAWPERLDLTDDLVFEAVKRGVKTIICTDAHKADQMELMRYGVDVARRGWAEKKNVVNALSYNEFIKNLQA